MLSSRFTIRTQKKHGWPALGRVCPVGSCMSCSSEHDSGLGTQQHAEMRGAAPSEGRELCCISAPGEIRMSQSYLMKKGRRITHPQRRGIGRSQGQSTESWRDLQPAACLDHSLGVAAGTFLMARGWGLVCVFFFPKIANCGCYVCLFYILIPSSHFY